MTYVQSVNCENLRIILCMVFVPDAPPDRLAGFKAALIASPEILHSVEVAGTFDFMVEVGVPDVLSYNRWLSNHAVEFSRLVSRYEVNFVSNRFVRKDRPEHSIWVPCADGMRRVDCSLINKMTAAGDYVELHAKGKSWMLHATMRSLVQRLPPAEFVQLHRSVIVRCDFISRMIHEGRHWVARLDDGSMERVARSHVTDTLGALRAHSPMHQPASSKR
jgi:hypothetical protein